MDITRKLMNGIKLDLKKPLTEDARDAFRILLGKEQDYVLFYESYPWNYWNGNDGAFYKVYASKYDRKQMNILYQTKRECEEKYKNYVEIEYNEGEFCNAGCQILSCEKNGNVYIRIVPYGFRFEEEIELVLGNYAYYIIYDIMEKKINIGWNDDFDIESNITERECMKCQENGFLEDEIDMEEMNFRYDYELGYDPIDMIYKILNQYEPKLVPWPYSYTIMEELPMIKRQMEYPIYANPEARERIKSFKNYEPESFEKLGMNPKEYDLWRFLGINGYAKNKIDISSIPMIRKWDMIIRECSLEELIRYYTEIHKITILPSEIELFLGLFDMGYASPQETLKFVLGAVADEGLGLYDTLSNVKKLAQEGKITSWHGRYSKKLINKINMRKTTTLSEKILDSLEEKPTLDNLYKQLILLKEA